MLKTIYVPVDNSDHSNLAMELAVKLGEAFGSELIGNHVYAATMHDKRFKQMEFTLPEEYREETELERQRKIHDGLIGMGLQLISDSYLDVMDRMCGKAGVPFRRRTFDGRTFQPIVDDVNANGYDLVVMGAIGTGAVKESVMGSVCERVVRRVRADVLVVKELGPLDEQFARSIVVAIDGSPYSYAGLKMAIELSKKFGSPVHAVAVYDPYLHYTVFSGIVDVLSEKASKVFKFKEQEKLHEEIIDTGLAKIYQAHLEVAQGVAKEEGVDLEITLMDGKAFEKVLKFVRKTNPWLLVMGRIGYHSDAGMDIGSNSENMLRQARCHCLLVSRQFVPAIDMKADAAVTWSEEAVNRMHRVPEFVRGIARIAILRFAMERGHSVITSSVIDQVMDMFMPKRSTQAIENLAYSAAVQDVQSGNGPVRFICSHCGHVVKMESSQQSRDAKPPEVCVVCGKGADQFQKIDAQVVSSIVQQEGGTTADETFDGVRQEWTQEARILLLKLPKGLMRKRAKARIEKYAKVRGITTITKEVAENIVEETQEEELRMTSETVKSSSSSPDPVSQVSKGLEWTNEAMERLNRVPAGFMRTMTKEKIETYAKGVEANTITLEVVEAGLVQARQVMQEMIQGYVQKPEPVRETVKEEPSTNA